MDFTKGDKVKIIPQEQTFYTDMYTLTNLTGVVYNQRGGITYVTFDNSNSITGWAVLSKDLELVKMSGQQLLFDFMRE